MQLDMGMNILVFVSLQLEGSYGGDSLSTEAGDCGQVTSPLSASVSLQKQESYFSFHGGMQASCFKSWDILSL